MAPLANETRPLDRLWCRAPKWCLWGPPAGRNSCFCNQICRLQQVVQIITAEKSVHEGCRVAAVAFGTRVFFPFKPHCFFGEDKNGGFPLGFPFKATKKGQPSQVDPVLPNGPGSPPTISTVFLGSPRNRHAFEFPVCLSGPRGAAFKDNLLPWHSREPPVEISLSPPAACQRNMNNSNWGTPPKPLVFPLVFLEANTPTKV